MGCFLDDLRAFGINTDQRTTNCSPGRVRMTQNGGTRGGTLFHGEMDRFRGSQQGWTTTGSRMPERAGKDQGEDSPKQAGSCWFARPC